MKDPVIEAIQKWLDEHDACVDSDCHAEHIEALRAVLRLDPSASLRQVVLAIAGVLGVASEWLAESYEAMPEQMGKML